MLDDHWISGQGPLSTKRNGHQLESDRVTSISKETEKKEGMLKSGGTTSPSQDSPTDVLLGKSKRTKSQVQNSAIQKMQKGDVPVP
jgi:hypothetical protein